MTDWTSLNYVVVDVEGNGQQPPDLVELAVVPIVDGVIGEPVSWLVRPETPIKHFARKVHGITNDAVANAPVFDDIKSDVVHALAADGLIAHNAHVDVGVLRRKLGEWNARKSSTLSNSPAVSYPMQAATNSAASLRNLSWPKTFPTVSPRTAPRMTYS